MSTIIIIALIVWGISSICKSASAKKAERNRQAQIAKLNAENARRKAEQARIREEFRQRQLEAKAEINRMVALEREQMKLRKEQERRAIVLAKHEEEIEKLQFRMAQAESDIKHWTEHLGNLYALLDIEQNAQIASVPGSNEDVKHQRKIITLTNQIHTAESRLAKAQYTKSESERKMSA